MTTSAAGFFSVACMSTGMPRPLSITVTLLSSCTLDVDLVAVAGHRFVNRVIDHFPYEMVQAEFAGRADVHRGAFADSFKPAEDFDRSRVVLVPGALDGRSLFVSHGSCVSSDAWRGFAQKTPGRYTLRFSGRARAGCDSFREGGRAECARHLPCPLVPRSRIFFARAGTRRVFRELHPVLFRKFRADAAKLFSPRGRGCSSLAPCHFQPPVLALAGLARRKFGANKVPFRKNPEHQNFTGMCAKSQGDCESG